MLNVAGLPLVSVLVPAYNHGAFVEECLASVAASDYPRLELLIIDDGSTDDTYERIRHWRTQHTSAFERFVVTSRPNRGLNATLNELIIASSGEFLCLLGSDDRLTANGISARVAALRANAKLWAVFGDCNVIDQDGVETHKSGFELNSADVTALSVPSTMAIELVWRWSVPGPVLMVRREAFFARDGYGLYPENRKVEDREFYLWALSCGRLGFVPEQVASYRIHSSNISRVLSALTEAENKEAEWAMAARFRWPLRFALRLRCLLYRLKSRHAAKGRAPSQIERLARSLEWRLTAFVLGRNSRRARLGARGTTGPGPLPQGVACAPKQATIDRGL